MAGFLYLIYIATTIFASVVNAKLIVIGDAAAIGHNIMADVN
jgi:hypothetical protein